MSRTRIPSPTPAPRRRAARGLALCTALAWLVAVTPAQSPEPGIGGTITGEGFSRIKIAVPSAGSDADARELTQALREDLTFSGFFDVIDPSLYGLVAADADPGRAPRHEDWISIGADALVISRLERRDGRLQLDARLWDNASATLLLGKRYGGSTELLRRLAHQLADDLVLQYTGRNGVALTRIAFVSSHGQGKEIYLMDYDGRRIRRLTTSDTINLSPAWSPAGDELAFVSWRGKQPGVYVMSAEGELGSLPVLPAELSSAPDWSPDGRQVVYSADPDGNTEVYLLDRDTGRNRRLTFNEAIDTSPAFSPNHREIAFTSDRSGTPQIYLMDVDGLNVRRVSWEGSYSDSAAWSPRGDKLAFVSRIEGRFEIVVVDLTTERTRQITRAAGNNENPRWSPDGRHLVFASSRGGEYQIYTIRADGSNVRQLTRGRESFTPDWSR